MPAFVRQHATRFLLFPALAMLLASCMSATPRPDAPPVVIKLIAFNDFHGHINPPTSPTRLQSANEGGRALELSTGGIAYLSTLIAQLKAQNPLHAVVGAGDMIGGSPLVSTLFHHEPAIELLGKAGLEFTSVGNHEFDAGRELEDRIVGYHFHYDSTQGCINCAQQLFSDQRPAMYQQWAKGGYVSRAYVSADGKIRSVMEVFKEASEPQQRMLLKLRYLDDGRVEVWTKWPGERQADRTFGGIPPADNPFLTGAP